MKVRDVEGSFTIHQSDGREVYVELLSMSGSDNRFTANAIEAGLTVAAQGAVSCHGFRIVLHFATQIGEYNGTFDPIGTLWGTTHNDDYTAWATWHVSDRLFTETLEVPGKEICVEQ
jgi:hypothetical protein